MSGEHITVRIYGENYPLRTEASAARLAALEVSEDVAGSASRQLHARSCEPGGGRDEVPAFARVELPRAPQLMLEECQHGPCNPASSVSGPSSACIACTRLDGS